MLADNEFNLAPEEMQRRKTLLREDLSYQAAQRLWFRSANPRIANEGARIMHAREVLVFTSAQPERVIQQANVAVKTARR